MAWSCVPYQLPAHGGPEKWDEIREGYGDKVDRLLLLLIDQGLSAQACIDAGFDEDFVKNVVEVHGGNVGHKLRDFGNEFYFVIPL